MAKLTDSQLIILSTAVARDDGAAIVPPKMNKAAAMKIGSNLVARKLMREIKSKPGTPIWREADGRPVSLIVTAAGRKSIAVKDETCEVDATPAVAVHAVGKATTAHRGALQSPRTGTKRALLIAMLSTENGATLDGLIKATGWLPHTTRAALTGLRKAGHTVVRFKNSDNVTAYKIANGIFVATEVANPSRHRSRSTGESAALPPTA